MAKLLERGYRVRGLVRSSARAADAAALFGSPAGVDAVVCCTGTTAFPSARWRDGNGPRETDQIGVTNLARATPHTSVTVSRRAGRRRKPLR